MAIPVYYCKTKKRLAVQPLSERERRVALVYEDFICMDSMYVLKLNNGRAFSLIKSLFLLINSWLVYSNLKKKNG